MTQEDAIKCLKENKRWLTTREVADKTGMSINSACRNLGVLFKHKEIMRKQTKKEYHYTYSWRIK